MAERSKILFLVPSITAKGGISNYYEVLKSKFNVEVEYFLRGARTWPVRKGQLYELFRALKDLVKYYFLLRGNNQYALIQTSTSLGLFSIIRDGLFVLVAKHFKTRAIVFFRGLNRKVELQIEQKYLSLFKWMYFRADSMIVLSNHFKSKLFEWGYDKPIYLETTVVDESLIEDISEDFITRKFNDITSVLNLLFLARVEIPKGIYETIDSYQLAKEKHLGLTLTIAGDGFEVENVRKYIVDNYISDVKLLGFIQGDDKIRAFKDSHIYMFPSHTEGMPTSVLEAMAFGLPVITRPVGGVVDFFKNGENGFITESKDPKVFAGLIEKLLADPQLMLNIALRNHREALQKFTTSKVVERLENIYTAVMQ